MKKGKLILILLVLLGISDLYAEDTKKLRIAIFDVKAGTSVTQGDADSITVFLNTYLTNSKKFNIIDRQNISRILKEQKFTQQGCTDTSCDVQVGKLLSANKILTGTVFKFGANFTLSVYLIDVQKGTQDEAAKVSSPSIEGLESASEHLVEKLIAIIENKSDEPTQKPIAKETNSDKPSDRSGAIWRSALLPGWGQFYQNENLKGSLFLASFLGGIGIFASGSSDLTAAKSNVGSADTLGLVGAFIEPGVFGILSYSQANSAKQSMQGAASTMQIGSGVAIAAYLFSLLDVALLGNKGVTARDSGIQFRANLQNTATSDFYSRNFEKTMSIEYRWRF